MEVYAQKIFFIYFLNSFACYHTICMWPKQNQSIYQTVKETKSITWGVKADTPLFGSMSIKDGKVRGFEIDLAEALTHKILGKQAKANFVTTTANTKINY